eukprot:764998-Hanusia_phi.AAC.3
MAENFERFVSAISDMRRPFVLDGGQATQMEQEGVDLSGHLWSARLLRDNPSMVKKTHVAFFLAGADVAVSASYQGTVEGFKRAGMSDEEGQRLLKFSIKLIREARDEAWEQMHKHGSASKRMKPFAGASVGCYGASLADGSEYTGGSYGISLEELRKFHLDRLKLFAEEAPDVFAFETSEMSLRR